MHSSLAPEAWLQSRLHCTSLAATVARQLAVSVFAAVIEELLRFGKAEYMLQHLGLYEGVMDAQRASRRLRLVFVCCEPEAWLTHALRRQSPSAPPIVAGLAGLVDGPAALAHRGTGWAILEAVAVYSRRFNVVEGFSGFENTYVNGVSTGDYSD